MTVYNDEISEYITGLFAEQDDALVETIKSIEENDLPRIQVKPEEGRFLQFIVRSVGVERAVEIGTLGGYSGIWITRGMKSGGKLISLEKDAKHAGIARQNFKKAGIDQRVEVRNGDAHALLKQLSSEGPFDFIFIDAEKSGYLDYFEWAVTNVRTGGIIAAHNAFRHGEIINRSSRDEGTVAIRELEEKVSADPRLVGTIYPAGDGMLLAVKTT